MPTIKDVAKLAKVSHGTVSNVINGSKSVSLDKIKRVEKAMQELGYNPNAIAQNLKKSSTMQIDIILPQILLADFSRIYSTIVDVARGKGYLVNLYITNEDADLETKLLENSQMFNRDGVILLTCQPGNVNFFKQLIKNGLKIVFIERAVKSLEDLCITVDTKEITETVIDEYLAAKKTSHAIILGPLEYSYEEQCYRGYIDAHRKNKIRMRDQLVVLTNYDKESAFKEAVRILADHEKIDAIFVSNTQFEEAVIQAMDAMDIETAKRPELIVLTSMSWIRRSNKNTRYVEIPFRYMALCAFFSLYKQMNGLPDDEPKVISVERPNETKHRETVKGIEQKVLRVLLTKDAISMNLSKFVPRFEKRFNCKVEITTKEYHETYQTIDERWQDFDVIDLDIPWLPELAQRGVISGIDSYLEQGEDIREAYPKSIVDRFCMWEGNTYGLPLTFSSQLLFYRKDYFEDLQTRRLFYSQHKRELTVPANWQEFNEVARFFTQAYNPSSPTKYGTTLGAQKYSGALCEFLPRFWASGGEIFRDGKFHFDTEASRQAMSSYQESFCYANPESSEFWWEEQSAEFRKGDSAMMIMFGDNAATVTERTRSEIVGKIGYDYIPGRMSVTGGWTVAVTKSCQDKDLAYEFVHWLSEAECARINTIMGGFVPRKSVLEDLEIAHVYPWLHKTISADKYSRQRTMPRKKDGTYFSESIFEEIVGSAVYAVIKGRMSIEDALAMANEQLNDEFGS